MPDQSQRDVFDLALLRALFDKLRPVPGQDDLERDVADAFDLHARLLFAIAHDRVRFVARMGEEAVAEMEASLELALELAFDFLAEPR